MTARPDRRLDVVSFSLAMLAFGLCAHRPALLLPRLLALLAAGLSLVCGLARARDLPGLFGLARAGRRRNLFLPLAVALGAGLGAWYRSHQGRPLLPASLTWFCLVAAGIGLCEEVAYRGIVQGRLRACGPLVAAAAVALAHTAYKCSLFVLVPAGVRVDILWLGVLTGVVGFLFGLMREGFGLPFPVAAHVAFDVVSYGDLTVSPWWT